MEKQGLSLLRLLIEATGLPHEAVERELSRLLETAGFNRENLTLEDVRELLSVYLQDVLLEAKEFAG